MKNTYSFLAALVIAATSLASCSRSNYAFNPATPAYLGSQPTHTVAAVKPPTTEVVALAKVQETAPASATKVAGVEVKAQKTAPVVVAPAPAATVANTSATAEVAVAPATVAKAAKPSLVQRIALKSLVKQITKLQQKQAVANTQHTASKMGRAALIALAGLLLAIIGLVIVGGSGFSGSGGGVVIGVILFYVGFIAFVVGLVLLVVHLINGD